MIYPSNVDEIVTDHRQPVSALFVASRRLFALALRSAVNQDRSILVNALLSCTGLLNGVMIEQARPATIEELRQYHDLPYLVALANCLLLSPRQLAAHGLQGDCPPFPDLLEFASICAGGSLQAADALASERTRLAVHLDGGRHHARRALAAGFCYVNDVVLAILRLLDTFERVLYVDIDVHHGDAVEEAFFSTDRVLTLSMHRCDPGFFPGTGQMGTGGEGPGRGFALNLSLAEGLRDDLFCAAFERLATGAVRVFRPHCVVLQW